MRKKYTCVVFLKVYFSWYTRLEMLTATVTSLTGPNLSPASMSHLAYCIGVYGGAHYPHTSCHCEVNPPEWIHYSSIIKYFSKILLYDDNNNRAGVLLLSYYYLAGVLHFITAWSLGYCTALRTPVYANQDLRCQWQVCPAQDAAVALVQPNTTSGCSRIADLGPLINVLLLAILISGELLLKKCVGRYAVLGFLQTLLCG